MKFTIRKKVLVCSLLPLVLLGAIVILVAATIMKGAIIQHVENSLRGTATATQAAYDQNTGSYLKRRMVMYGKAVTIFPSPTIW